MVDATVTTCRPPRGSRAPPFSPPGAQEPPCDSPDGDGCLPAHTPPEPPGHRPSNRRISPNKAPPPPLSCSVRPGSSRVPAVGPPADIAGTDREARTWPSHKAHSADVAGGGGEPGAVSGDPSGSDGDHAGLTLVESSHSMDGLLAVSSSSAEYPGMSSLQVPLSRARAPCPQGVAGWDCMRAAGGAGMKWGGGVGGP